MLSIAVAMGCAATSASAQTFDISNEIDLDALTVITGASNGADGLHVDFRLRTEAEMVTQTGRRWGLSLEAVGRTHDGRRALQPDAAPAGPGGLVTGLGGSGRNGRASAGVSRADIFVRGSVLELYAGVGETAARTAQSAPARALRLAAADGPLIDAIGGGLVDTRLTVSAPAPRILVQSRRLVGFGLSASYTPEGDACGADRCLDARFGQTTKIFSGAVNFDRRDPVTRTRWTAVAGFEAGQAERGPLSGPLEDPWLASVQILRDADGVTFGVRALHARDGLVETEYSAVSGRVAIERGDWLFDAELGRAHSDAVNRDGWTAQVAGSRLVGSRGVIGAGVQLHDRNGAALVVETGLRF